MDGLNAVIDKYLHWIEINPGNEAARIWCEREIETVKRARKIRKEYCIYCHGRGCNECEGYD